MSPDRQSPAGLRDVARPTRPAWAEIDLDAIRENVRALRALLRPPARLMAVVKGDGYGHGAVEVARTSLDAGAEVLGVGTVDEGVELRRAGVTAPTLVLAYTPPRDAGRAVEHDLSVTVFQAEVARALSHAAGRHGRRARVHLKVDTGMGRIGVAPGDAAALAREISALPGVVLEGCFTHFATADEPDLGPARAQLEAFRTALEDIGRVGIRIAVRHAANSAATLALPDAHLDLVRVGIATYGIAPAPHLAGCVRLRPAMRLCAQVAHAKRVAAGTPIGYGHAYRTARETTIATIPLGYADGYPRVAAGCVMIGGRRHPIAGRVSMDQLMVDAGDAPVRAGDEVELWGQGIRIEEVADSARTISYEVLVRLGRRVPRVFVASGRVWAVRTMLDDG
jgi:alanine racemase